MFTDVTKFTSLSEIQKWRHLSDGAIVVTSFHRPTSLRIICLSADEKLFSAIIRDSDHVLHKLLPPLTTASQSYNLRERKHNYLLPLRTGRLSDDILSSVCCI